MTRSPVHTFVGHTVFPVKSGFLWGVSPELSSIGVTIHRAGRLPLDRVTPHAVVSSRCGVTVSGDSPDPPSDLPAYVLDPLEKQSPDDLEAVAAYAAELAAWKRQQRAAEVERRREAEAVDEETLEDLSERGISTDEAEYEDVPATGAYITVKETKPGYRYYYWQWREGDSWKNEYIAPVTPRE